MWLQHANEMIIGNELRYRRESLYKDLFTLNVVGGGEKWSEMEYWNDSIIYHVNTLCDVTEAQKKEFHTKERILYLSSTEQAGA